MTKYAVTGATGKLGRIVLDELLQKTDPANVVALARDPTTLQKYDQLGVQVRPADYDDPASLDAALQGVDRVLMISGILPAALIAVVLNLARPAPEVGAAFVDVDTALPETVRRPDRQ